MRTIAFQNEEAFEGYLRASGATVLRFACKPAYAGEAAELPPGFESMRYSTRRTYPFPADQQGVMDLFAKLDHHALPLARAQPENRTLALWKHVVQYFDDGLHIAYKGEAREGALDERLVEWVDFQLRLTAQYDGSLQCVDAIYVRSLNDVAPMIGKTITDKRGTQAVLQQDSAVAAALTNITESDGRRARKLSPQGRRLRRLKQPVPVIGLMELLHATFGECFTITVTNPRAAHRWSLVRAAWKAAPFVKHWIHEANRPDHAGYRAGVEDLCSP